MLAWDQWFVDCQKLSKIFMDAMEVTFEVKEGYPNELD